jgi:hypothetical protein
LKISEISPSEWWQFLKRKLKSAKRFIETAANPKRPRRDSFPAQRGTAREKLMIHQANGFANASRIVLNAQSPENPQFGLVFGVCGAFSVELYLKLLLTVEGAETIPVTHNLKILFNQVSKESRGKLRKQHNELVVDDPVMILLRARGIKTDLDSLLEQGQDVFEQFRYIYEGVPSTEQDIGFGLGIFGGCVRNRILDLRLEWLSDAPTSQAQ